MHSSSEPRAEPNPAPFKICLSPEVKEAPAKPLKIIDFAIYPEALVGLERLGLFGLHGAHPPPIFGNYATPGARGLRELCGQTPIGTSEPDP
jgi:hypothetical protein